MHLKGLPGRGIRAYSGRMARLQSKSRAGLDKDGLAKKLEFVVEVGRH